MTDLTTAQQKTVHTLGSTTHEILDGLHDLSLMPDVLRLQKVRLLRTKAKLLTLLARQLEQQLVLQE